MKIEDIKIAFARKKFQGSAPAVTEGRLKKMGIILEAGNDDLLHPFLELMEDLKLSEEDIQIIICRKAGVKNDLFEYPSISIKDLSWKGNISEEALAFLSSSYEVLISFTAEGNKLADFLVEVGRADLKAGRKKADKNAIFDLNISAELSEPEVFTRELKKYIPILKYSN
ncbi:DUF6913 domain-containing protein [Salinimicrobium sp. HB62]|uniref:DUF6913 domain-containing protein n=1 Tax=Salinimicrobium sp. HB62 TaxID=3077781 RepID=UPI002D781C72|nr:hypothetical protein [Salinimicrobium sp. HB62]